MDAEIQKSVLVVFGKNLPSKPDVWWKQFSAVIAPQSSKDAVESFGCAWINIAEYKDAGSIYEASDLLQELSLLKNERGERITKMAQYEGYELWWIHYTDLFIYFCLPYTQYRRLLEHLTTYDAVTVYEPPFRGLFQCFLKAHSREMEIVRRSGFHMPELLPFGILVQILLTVIFFPILMVLRRPIMLFIGDKFDGKNDFDFRMRFIYEALRAQNARFVECVRSLQPTKTLLLHVLRRKRPVFYVTAALFIARHLSVFTRGRRRTMERFAQDHFMHVPDVAQRFKFLIATQYLLTSNDEVWEIRMMRKVLKLMGVRTAFIAAGSERNFSTLIACKLESIPVVGILHGVASPHYNVYEFMPTYDGEKVISVDQYGVWSEWWRQFFIKESKMYAPDRLFVSGPMRPLTAPQAEGAHTVPAFHTPVKVLFVSEEMAVPEEVLPYLTKLLSEQGIEVGIKLRPYRDEFESWLIAHHPELLNLPGIHLMRGSMQDAIREYDVVVGCQSTGVLEAVLLRRIPIFFRTSKWGDYFRLVESGFSANTFAENPDDLIAKIRNAHAVDVSVIDTLKEQYFGDPYKNGSAWVADQLIKQSTTKRS